jgi:hypothetical protein
VKGTDLSLLDALTAPQTKPEPRSKIAALLEKVSGPEQQALKDALRSPEWTNERLSEVLTASGHSVSESGVRRYRKAHQL